MVPCAHAPSSGLISSLPRPEGRIAQREAQGKDIGASASNCERRPDGTNPDVRRAAAQALRIGPDVKEAVSALSATLAKDADAGVRAAAADALGGIGPAAKEESTVEKCVPRKISPHRGCVAIIQILGGTLGSVRLSRRSSFNLVRGSRGQLKF